MNNSIIIGPFKQILTMDRLPDSGPIHDNSLEIISNGSVLIENQKIVKVLSEKRQVAATKWSYRSGE